MTAFVAVLAFAAFSFGTAAAFVIAAAFGVREALAGRARRGPAAFWFAVVVYRWRGLASSRRSAGWRLDPRQ